MTVLKLIEANGVSEAEYGPTLRDEGYNCARAYLETHESKVVKLAARLVECGSVDAAEFLRLMNNEET